MTRRDQNFPTKNFSDENFRPQIFRPPARAEKIISMCQLQFRIRFYDSFFFSKPPVSVFALASASSCYLFTFDCAPTFGRLTSLSPCVSRKIGGTPKTVFDVNNYFFECPKSFGLPFWTANKLLRFIIFIKRHTYDFSIF